MFVPSIRRLLEAAGAILQRSLSTDVDPCSKIQWPADGLLKHGQVVISHDGNCERREKSLLVSHIVEIFMYGFIFSDTIYYKDCGSQLIQRFIELEDCDGSFVSIIRSLAARSGTTTIKKVLGTVRRTPTRSKLVPKLADLAEAAVEHQ